MPAATASRAYPASVQGICDPGQAFDTGRPDRINDRHDIGREAIGLLDLHLSAKCPASLGLRRLPSLAPWALRADSAALVRSPIIRRSFSAKAA